VESGFEIAKWDRFFALYENGQLLCVTVYKKGARAVGRRIEELKAKIVEAQKGKPQNQGQKEARHVEHSDRREAQEDSQAL
jgi:hypothetical protein